MRPGIVTDSTCDLAPELIAGHGIEVVPSILILDGQELADGIGISRQEFYTRLPEYKSAPTTAAPSIGEFAVRYERLLQGGCEQVVSIHAAATLSGIVAAAQQAASDFRGRVTIVDSGSLSLGLGFQVLAAAESAVDGTEAALQAIESTRRRLRLFAALDTLTYARRSGRIPAALTFLGSALQVKPLIEVVDGEVKAVAALRTTTRVTERMAAFLHQGGQLERLAILHTGAEPRAREFLKQIMLASAQSMPRDIQLVNVTPVIGAHVGPNGLGFAAVRV